MMASIRPVRVTFLFTSLDVGGAERIGCELIRHLDRRKFQVSVICLKQLGLLGEELQKACDISVVSGLKAWRFDPFAGGRLASTLRALRPDVLCMFGAGGDRSFWGRIAGAWTGVPVRVCCPHAMGDYEPWEPYNRILNSLTDAFVAISERHRLYLIREAHLPASKVVVIENGIDTERFQPPHEGRPRNDIRIGLVAMLRPEKNVLMFLRVAKLMKERGIEAQFLIVGDGPDRPLLEKSARDMGVDDLVRFCGLCPDVCSLYHELDIVALTSRFEVLPCSLMEAMACGLPVVATDVGAVADLVEDGTTGFLVSPDDDRAFAEAVIRLVRSPDLRRQMGRAGRKRVEEQFSLMRMVERFEGLFADLLRQKRRSNGHALTRDEALQWR